MPFYEVTLYFHASAYFVVEADNEGDALAQANLLYSESEATLDLQEDGSDIHELLDS